MCIHTVEVERPDGSPKVNFAVLLLLRSEELGRAAYMGVRTPPMGVYRTAIVQGLSIEHGRGERRQFSPVKTEVISITLKDTVHDIPLVRGRAEAAARVKSSACVTHRPNT